MREGINQMLCMKAFSELVVHEDVGGEEGTDAFLARSRQVLSHYCGGRALLYMGKSFHFCQAKLIFSKSSVYSAIPTFVELI